MKLKQITVASFLAAGFAASSASALADDVTQNREVKTFSKIVVEGAVDITIEAGKKQSVELTSDDEHIDRLTTTVKGDTLVIAMTGRKWRDAEVDVRISMAKLVAFDVEGAVDAHISGVDSDEFSVQIDGAGDIYLNGKCGTADIEVNGAGDIDAEEFRCENVKIVINGAGDAEIYASKSVEAQINGVGDIDVYGDPDKVNPRISGIGDFEIKRD